MSSDECIREEQIIYGFIILLLSPVVVVACVDGTPFDGGPGFCLCVAVLAACGLLRSWNTNRVATLPRAVGYLRSASTSSCAGVVTSGPVGER
jgi:hypothetical protein